ncbi:hypothetical protein BC829DRAFT_421514 [Chytridium lagenaria]|nr:hypothetical protein BC829DRAFT_421514 [Chytridium lagenaria]
MMKAPQHPYSHHPHANLCFQIGPNLVRKFQEEHEESKVSSRKFAERHNVDHTALKRWEDNIAAIELQANQKKKYVRKPAKRKGEEEELYKPRSTFVIALTLLLWQSSREKSPTLRKWLKLTLK